MNATDDWDAYWAQHDSALIASPELEGLGVDVEAAIENGALWLATRLAAEAFVQVDLPARRVGWRTSSFEGAGLPGTQVVLQRLRQDASAENADAQIDGRGSYVEVSGGVDVRVSGSPGETRGLANWLREQTVPGCVEGELPITLRSSESCTATLEWLRLDDPQRTDAWTAHLLRRLLIEDRVEECIGGRR